MINNKKILSVVLARAGSKGVKGKNYRPLIGVPLICWSICSSLRSKYVDLTVVSSNCRYIKDITFNIIDKLKKNEVNEPRIFFDLIKSRNLEFIQRPDEYATDISKNEEALKHAYEYSKRQFNFDADIIVNLQPTSPIRDTRDSVLLDDCLEKMENEKADSLFAVKKCTPFFVHEEHGEYIMNNKTLLKNRPMRQELNLQDWFLHDCGNVYLTNSSILLSENNRIGPNFTVFVLDQKRSLQIDSELDFMIIEEVMKEFL